MKFKDLSITFHTDKTEECVDFYRKYFQTKVAFDDGEWYVVIRLETETDTLPIYLSFQGDGKYYDREKFTGGITCCHQMQQSVVSFCEDITDHEWGDRAFSIKDPIGNILYIYSDRELHEKYKYAVKE